MGNKALIFDISVKRMKEDGMSKSDISKVYSMLGKELAEAGFDDRIQHSVYRTTNGDGINALISLLGNKDRFPLFCKYKERVHWMGCDEYSDVTNAFDCHQTASHLINPSTM
jgi:virulence-associated protein VapD